MISLTALAIILSTPFHVVVTIFRHYLGVSRFHKYKKRLLICIKLTIFRQVLSVPPNDTKYLVTPSIESVLKTIKSQNPAVIGTLSHYGEKYGPSGYWLHKDDTRSTSDPIVIYLHGGAYLLKTISEQMKNMIAVSKLIDPSKKVSVLHVEYDLVANGFTFPRQVRQLDSVYTRLVEEGNTNFVLAGDSAGGHFAITYTEFIRLKKPYLPYPSKLVLISPWVNLAVDERDYKPGLSYYESRHRDYIGYEAFKKPKNGLMFIDDEHRVDHSFLDWSYRCPVDWKRNPFFTNPDNEVFVVYGEHESFRDDIDTWLRQIYELPKIPYETSNGKQIPEFSFTSQEEGKPKLTAYVEPWGVHDAFFLLEGDLLDKYKDFDQLPDESYFTAKRLVKFFNDHL